MEERGLSLNQTSFTKLWDWSMQVVFRMWPPTGDINLSWELVINASSQAPPQTFCITSWGLLISVLTSPPGGPEAHSGLPLPSLCRRALDKLALSRRTYFQQALLPLPPRLQLNIYQEAVKFIPKPINAIYTSYYI